MDARTLSETFEEHRSRLLRMAIRSLGSLADAEDAVQETWLRLEKQDAGAIDNLAAWLTRVIGRICLDVLRRRSNHGESALDTWEADLVVTEDADNPEAVATVTESVGLAMAIILDSLGPEERLAFVLHDVFAVPFAEIGPIVGRSPDATKMLASRARKKVRESPLPTGNWEQRRQVVDAFRLAAQQGDFEGLIQVLDPGVSWHRYSPKGYEVTIGAHEVLAAVRRGNFDRLEVRRVNVNDEPGILTCSPKGDPLALMSCTVAEGKLVSLISIADPVRLSRMGLSMVGARGGTRTHTS